MGNLSGRDRILGESVAAMVVVRNPGAVASIIPASYRLPGDEKLCDAFDVGTNCAFTVHVGGDLIDAPTNAGPLEGGL
ncbi:hypothetical protein [Palleronia aestuarii]|uniref:hypothetical protein n=1 Tax=Palleronia aestuarii TaxID=568105 RepID=UPI000DAE3EFC|nr:hypothetical protein [Palleronia aestuarii]